MKKYSILTFNFNNYEILREPAEVDDDCEYVLVTDDKSISSKTWDIKYLSDEFNNADGFTKSFYVRYHPFEFVNTDVCICIDGSVNINKSLNKLYNDFVSSNADMSLMVHYCACTPYNEFPYWINCRNYDQNQAAKSMAFLREIGLNQNYKGYFETGFKICKNNTICNALHDFTYERLCKVGKDKNHIERVDQAIFSAIVNTQFTNKIKVFPVTRQIIQNNYLTYCFHGTNKPLIVQIDYDNLWMFNNKIKVYVLN